jgi:hypothetical protein
LWFADTLGALKAAFHDRTIRYAVLALLVVDAIVLGLYVGWSFAETYDVTDSFFYKPIFSTRDWGLIETAGYIKELASGLMITWIALRTRSVLFAALALLFALILTGDSLRLHELLADPLVAAGVPFSISEFVAMAMIGAIPAIACTGVDDGIGSAASRRTAHPGGHRTAAVVCGRARFDQACFSPG